MAIIIPDPWVDQVYAKGVRVEHNGIGYEAIGAVAEGGSNPVANSDWKVYAVWRVTDYYSLQDAVEFILNTNDTKVISSIPLFIQNVGRKIGKLLRSPGQKTSRVFTVEVDDDDRSFIEVDGSILAVEHIRVNDDYAGGGDLTDTGKISIKRAQSRQQYEYLVQTYRKYGRNETQYPVYYPENDMYFFAPNFEAGTEIQLDYYEAVAELGSIVNSVNDDYVDVDANGETEADYSGDGTWVAETFTVTSNLWTETQPHLLLAGALADAFSVLRSPEYEQVHRQQYNDLLQSAEIEYRKYDTSGGASIQQRHQI